jgi:hypothetical protein
MVHTVARSPTAIRGSGFVGLGFVQLLLSNEAGFHQRLKALARVLGVP